MHKPGWEFIPAKLNNIKLATIDQLANVWEGEATQATISSFDEFAAKYFQNYEDIITQYVQFLRTNIEQGYFDTETQNIGLADALKKDYLAKNRKPSMLSTVPDFLPIDFEYNLFIYKF